MEKDKVNPLGTEPVGRLLRKFAIPSIISMLVTSLYNIVDQFFIGRTVGELGNAATNIAFPLTTMCLAAMLALGIGGAAGFNLNMGAGNKKKAMYFIGNALTVMFGVGVVIALISLFFMEPLLKFFGFALRKRVCGSGCFWLPICNGSQWRLTSCKSRRQP